LEQAEKRENFLVQEVEELRRDLVQVEKSYQRREETYVLESKGYLDQIQKYQKLIADNKIKAIQKLDTEYFDMSKKLKKEIENLRKQIEIRDDTISKMKDIETSTKTKERKDIKKILNKFREITDEWESHMKIYAKDQSGVNQLLLELNTKHNKAEEDLWKQLAASQEEIQQVKDELMSILSENYPERIADLEHQLYQTSTELNHAKVNLIEYINSLNTLEDIIKSNCPITENEEIQRLRLENQRLNSENSSLISTKKQTDSFYASQLSQLTSQLSSLTEKPSLSHSHSTLLKNLEVWRSREQTIRQNYDALESALQLFISQSKKSKDLKKQKTVLEQEEEYLKAKEEEKVERLIKLSREKWEEDKKKLNEEVFLLRQRIDRQEGYLQEVIERMESEVELFGEGRKEVERRGKELEKRIKEVEKVMQGM
jgi:hypothetical protein